MHTIRIWDLPTRLFHWLLAFCVVGLVVTGNVGGAWMEWHLRLGYAVVALLVFRVCWGFIGGRWSRFASFIYSPASLVRYLRGQAPLAHTAGHSPLGALAVFAMLLVLAAQVGTGLMSDDEIATFGPLVRFVSGDTVEAATSYHKNIGKFLVIGLVVIHLLAIAFYKLARRKPLTRAMVTGNKQLSEPMPAANDGWAHRLLALGLLVLAGAGVAWMVRAGTTF